MGLAAQTRNHCAEATHITVATEKNGVVTVPSGQQAQEAPILCDRGLLVLGDGSPRLTRFGSQTPLRTAPSLSTSQSSCLRPLLTSRLLRGFPHLTLSQARTPGLSLRLCPENGRALVPCSWFSWVMPGQGPPATAGSDTGRASCPRASRSQGQFQLCLACSLWRRGGPGFCISLRSFSVFPKYHAYVVLKCLPSPW